MFCTKCGAAIGQGQACERCGPKAKGPAVMTWSVVPRSRAARITAGVLAAATLLSVLAVARQQLTDMAEPGNAEATIEGTEPFYPTHTLEFHNAVDKGDLALVKRLLRRGADINARDKDGWTALHVAVTRRAWVRYDRNIAMVELLLTNGAEVSTTSLEGTTPLHTAAFFRNAKAIELLLARGADSNSKNASGETPLHVAAHHGAREAAVVLLAGGSDVNAFTNATGDGRGGTPLHYATKRHDRELITLFLANGADLHVMDTGGATPLAAVLMPQPGVYYSDAARTQRVDEIAKLLRQHGARD